MVGVVLESVVVGVLLGVRVVLTGVIGVTGVIRAVGVTRMAGVVAMAGVVMVSRMAGLSRMFVPVMISGLVVEVIIVIMTFMFKMRIVGLMSVIRLPATAMFMMFKLAGLSSSFIVAGMAVVGSMSVVVAWTATMVVPAGRSARLNRACCMAIRQITRVV